MGIRRVLRGVGAVLLSAGLLVLLFAAYEFWGTGLATASHQRALRQQFERELRAARDRSGHRTPTTVAAGRPAPTTTLPTTGVQPPAGGAPVTDGQPVGIIQIPAIGVDYVVVQGTDTADLELGPGHYAGTPMPGNPGNAAIAGHRTTYLHPFYDLNELVPGDPVYVTTAQGRFRYDVTGSEVVAPTDVAVLDPTPTPTLTLTTCNPRYSASTRLVVTARLVSPVEPPAGTVAGRQATAPRHGQSVGHPTPTATGELEGSTAGWGPAAGWGAACALVALAAWAVHRRARRWWVWALGGGGFMVLLFFFFGALSPLLPAGY